MVHNKPINVARLLKRLGIIFLVASSSPHWSLDKWHLQRYRKCLAD